ncbi:MAG TPA: cobalamin-dependent protein [Elusimicrobiota bacterium]|nr:cobalamin-dependent protein [Elusimicrobiota bacterium]
MTAARADVLLVHLRAARIPALAPELLASWARRDPALAEVVFETAEWEQTDSAEFVARQIAARRPKLVGFSCYVWNHRANRETVRRLKRLLPNTPIVLGGPEVSGAAEQELAVLKEADYICTGEGEETLRGLAHCVLNGIGPLTAVPGLAYRVDGRFQRNADAPLIDLSRTVSPFLSGRLNVAGADQVCVETSRGCPFTCTFCDWGPRTVRYVDEARLEAEFSLLAGKARMIQSTDADLTVHRARCIRLLETFLRATAGSPCVLSFELNPVFLAPEIVTVISRAPQKFFLACGIQSIREDVLKTVERTFDREKVERNLADLRVRAPGATVLFSAIYGLPGDDYEGLRETVDWCLQQNPTGIRFNHTQILPGTELERSAPSLGLIYQKDPPHQLLSSPQMNSERLSDAREFTAYFTVLMSWPDLRRSLMAAVHSRPAEPMAYVRIVEAWVEAVKSSGIPFGSDDWRKIDDRLVHSLGEAACERLQADPMSLAQLTHVTERVARSWREAARAPQHQA